MTLIAASEVTSRLAGPAALVVVLLLFVATVLLIRNMDKRLRRLPQQFPPDGHGVPRTGSHDAGPGSLPPDDRRGGTSLVELPPDR
jgi:hypothetical protein